MITMVIIPLTKWHDFPLFIKVGPEPHEWLEKDLRLLEMVWISGIAQVFVDVFFVCQIRPALKGFLLEL